MAAGIPFNSEYYSLVALVTTLMGLYVGIKYAAGKFLSNSEWQASAMIELNALWKALIALGIAVAFFEASKVLSYAVAGGDPITIASAFLQRVMFKGLLEAINDVFTIQMVYSIYNTFSFRPHEAVWTWTYKIVPGADAVVNMTSVIGYGLVAVFGSVSAQLMILSLIDATMYTFFLPAGILLMFFPPTRNAGIFLIVMAVGFQVIFPMTYVFNKMALDEIWIYTRGTEYTPYIGGTTAAFWKYMFLGSAFPVAMLGAEATNIMGKICGALKIICGPITGVLTATTLELTVYNLTFALFKPILEALAELSLVSLFMPALATTITFAFINALTKYVEFKV